MEYKLYDKVKISKNSSLNKYISIYSIGEIYGICHDNVIAPYYKVQFDGHMLMAKEEDIELIEEDHKENVRDWFPVKEQPKKYEYLIIERNISCLGKTSYNVYKDDKKDINVLTGMSEMTMLNMYGKFGYELCSSNIERLSGGVISIYYFKREIKCK